ncbi:unnamed protein product [Rotaria socialis]|uniref:FAD-binding FR-type domain-containing protein n=1 Tax=Rotaria socialis TaxID=392032 RepID=A0A820DN54_9BILA|nr:unnamed protein product [Rotaria socialis]
MLNTLSGMTKRLLAALGMPSENDDAPTLSTRDVQNITRVLNSTTDVRVLLLFKMVSGVDNVYVDQEGLTQLFEHYPRNVGTFAQDQYPEFFRVLLRKFQLNVRSRIVFGEFYAIVLDDPDALESLSRFTVHPDWCVGPSKQTSEPNFTTRPGIGWIGHFASLSGVILFVILSVMAIFSMQFIRRSGHFQKWIVTPLTIFIIEKLYYSLTQCSSNSGRIHIESATIEQSNVISLKIHRSKSFRFQLGDYIFINLPRVAPFEFHSFTVSSAPQESNYITVHIQAISNWTKRVYEYFKNMPENQKNERNIKVYRSDLNPTRAIVEHIQNADATSSSATNDIQNQNNHPGSSLPPSAHKDWIVINGLYSSCALYIFDANVSITTRKILQRMSFEWLLNLLRQFEEEQETYSTSNPGENRFLDIHLFFTQIKNDENIGNVPLDVVTKTWAQVAGNDIFTSLRTKTQIGRSNWTELFDRLISNENASTADDVNVFFRGSPIMGNSIREHCEKFRFHFFKEF